MSEPRPPRFHAHESISARALWRAVSTNAPRITGLGLDVGCGAAPYRQLIGPSATWIGVDLRPNLGRVVADAHALPFERDTFDGVLCTQVLEHLEDPGLAIIEAARVLKPGGRGVFTAPQVWSLHEAPRDFWRFTSVGLGRLFERADLKVEVLVPTTGAIATGVQVVVREIGLHGRAARSIRFTSWLADVLDRRFWYPDHPLDHLVVARKITGS